MGTTSLRAAREAGETKKIKILRQEITEIRREIHNASQALKEMGIEQMDGPKVKATFYFINKDGKELPLTFNWRLTPKLPNEESSESSSSSSSVDVDEFVASESDENSDDDDF